MLFLSFIFIVYVIIIKLHVSSLLFVLWSSFHLRGLMFSCYFILFFLLSRFLSFNFVLFSELISAFQDV